MGREKQMRAVSMQWALRLGVLLGAILGAVCASQAPVAAQTTAGTVKFFTDGALSKAWTRLDNSTTPATPLVEWGDTVWIKLEGAAFNNDNGAPPVTLKFRLVVPGTTNPPADYGFEIDGDQIVNKGSDYRVAFDAGFYRNGAGANIVWRMGVPQLAKVWPNGNADPNSADKKNAQLRPLAGMPNPPAVDKLVLTPGEWEVWATQNTMADTTHYKFRVMNPLTIRRYNPYTQVFDTTPWTDAVTSGQEFSDPAANDINGSPTFGTNRLLEAYAPPTPPVGFNQIWTLGQVDHGHTSAPYLFGVADRSRLDQVLAAAGFPATEAGSVCLACRAGFGDMNPTGGPDVTNPPNPAQPKDAYTTNPEDYPPIYRDRLSVLKYGGVENPVLQDVALQPRKNDQANNYPVQTDLYFTQVRVLQYQPDTTYSTGQAVPNPNSLPNAPLPTDPVRVWIDVNGNGKLDRIQHPDKPGYVYNPDNPTDTTQLPASYEILSTFSEPYREFNVAVNVPTDYRLAVQETTIDLGKHAHNVLNTAGSNELPAVRPFTVKNLGNVNLRHLRVADKYVINGQAGDIGINLYSPDTEFDRPGGSTAGLGLSITPEDWKSIASGQTPRKQIWWSFDDDPSKWEDAANGNEYIPGSLNKARPGAPSPTSIAGYYDDATKQIRGPRVAVISPFGQPVGTYANQYLVFEDNFPVGASDNRLDYVNLGNGAYQAMDTIAAAPFTLKISVTDRQLTEEPGAYGLDRPIVGIRNGNTAVQADSFLKLPSALSTPNLQLPDDSQPAVLRYRDPSNLAHRRMALYWTSNRPDARGPQPADPTLVAQDWYLYGARTYEIKDNNAYTWPFWVKSPYYNPSDAATTANPPEVKFPATSLFQKMANQGTLVSERYTSPSLTQTLVGGQVDPAEPAYLFFQGVGDTRNTLASGMSITHHAGQLYYTQLDSSMKPTGNVVAIGADQLDVMRHGVRGLSYKNSGGTHYLWGFWYGGPENSWQAYYSLNKGDKTKATDWKVGSTNTAGVLPLYGDFAYVQDIVPMLWSGYDITGAQKDYIDVAFTGFSRSRRNSDIYMARLDPAQLERSVSSAARAKIAFSRVVGEVLENNKNRVYYAQSLEWLTRPYVNTAGNPVFPVIYRKDSTGTVTQLTPDPTDSAAMGRWKYNATNFTYSYEFDYTSQDHPELNGKNKVTVYPMAGLVSFDRPMDAADVISADYTPAVMRLASSPQMESSPSVFLDTRIGPVQAGDGKRGYAPRHRLWVFYTRIAPQVTNPSVWYKTMRLMVQLPTAIDTTKGAVSVQDSTGRTVTAFTIDADRGRVYFPTYQVGSNPMGLEGLKVKVSYNGGSVATDYIRWRVETSDTPLPIDTIANEGKVTAIPDIAPIVNLSDSTSLTNYLNDPGTWRVWLFWSSAKPKTIVMDEVTNQPAAYSYDTDLRYMTIAPRLDFRADLP